MVISADAASPAKPVMSSYVVSDSADNVSDDVFVSPAESHHGAGYMLPPGAAGPPPHAPSPTGYRDYVPPAEAYSYSRATPDLQPVHKTILLGDSGVGKTSLLVQFDQGK
ncbi:hypothetical protein B566_EDAN015540, partial [Ephemera danica]